MSVLKKPKEPLPPGDIKFVSFKDFLADYANHTNCYHERSGVIPYARAPDNEIYLLIGIHHWHDLTDFGGTSEVINGKRESPYTCMIREVKEETSGILPDVIKRSLETRINEVICLKRTVNINSSLQTLEFWELLVPIPWDQSLPDKFIPNNEVAAIFWMKPVDLEMIIKWKAKEFNIRVIHFLSYMFSVLKRLY